MKLTFIYFSVTTLICCLQNSDFLHYLIYIFMKEKCCFLPVFAVKVNYPRIICLRLKLAFDIFYGKKFILVKYSQVPLLIFFHTFICASFPDLS